MIEMTGMLEVVEIRGILFERKESCISNILDVSGQ